MAVLDVLQSVSSRAWAPGALEAKVRSVCGMSAGVGGVRRRAPGRVRRRCSAELSAPRWGGGVLPARCPPSCPCFPHTVSIGHHSRAVTFRGCYPASEVGFRGGEIFCSPCTASEQDQVTPGVRGTLCGSPGGRQKARPQAERPEAGQDPPLMLSR